MNSNKSKTPTSLHPLLLLLLFLSHELGVLLLQYVGLELPLAFHLLLEIALVALHGAFEAALPARLEIDVLDDVVGNVGQIQQYHDHVGLLKPYSLTVLRHLARLRHRMHPRFLLEAYFEEVFSLKDECADVFKLIRIKRIREQLVPGRALHCLAGHGDAGEAVDGVGVGSFEAEVGFHVLVFDDEFFGAREFD